MFDGVDRRLDIARRARRRLRLALTIGLIILVIGVLSLWRNHAGRLEELEYWSEKERHALDDLKREREHWRNRTQTEYMRQEGKHQVSLAEHRLRLIQRSKEWRTLPFDVLITWTTLLVLLALFVFYALPLILLRKPWKELCGIWPNPPCVLLLRPFAVPGSRVAIPELLLDDISCIAHVYTLADSEVRPPWYVRLPLLLPQLRLTAVGRSRVSGEGSLRRLLRGVDRKRLRNLSWLLSKSKIFEIRCTDRLWRDCVRRMIAKANAILIDVSRPSPNLGWEVDICSTADHAAKVLLLTESRRHSQSLSFLRSLPRGARASPRLYRHEGARFANVDRREFLSQLRTTLDRA